MLTYIIDAYNVIHRHPSLRERAKKDIDGAREKLIAFISGFAGQGSKKVILVFDGTGRGEKSTSAAVQIIFPDPGNNADHKIKELINGVKNPKNLVIVSSDTEVAHYGKLHACRIMSANEFISMLSNEKNRQGDEKPSSISVKEKEEWLKLFGGEKE